MNKILLIIFIAMGLASAAMAAGGKEQSVSGSGAPTAYDMECRKINTPGINILPGETHNVYRCENAESLCHIIYSRGVWQSISCYPKANPIPPQAF